MRTMSLAELAGPSSKTSFHFGTFVHICGSLRASAMTMPVGLSNSMKAWEFTL